MNYAEYFLAISKLLKQSYAAAESRDFDAASNLAADIALYATSLAALLDHKTETEV
jgi:hypothetical protein